LAVVICCLVPFAQAQAAKDGAESSAAAALTAQDVAAFYDGLIPAQLRRDDIAGAVIAVVKDGRVLLARGYGYSDVQTKRPVLAEATLFRVGSISKLFTWTAVMQLVEQGKLDLDCDVNQYLDFQIPATYPQPITLRNLMTHTGGFQETIRDVRVRDSNNLQPLKQYLIEHLPPRIFQPGTTPAYSNYGTVLAAYIVQGVSGQSFEDYIDEHIFRPLGMQHSTFIQPLPDSLGPMMSGGYVNASEPAGSFELLGTTPSGGLSATADDMARFMIAHLQDGKFGEGRILKPETARLMHARQIELAPGMNGMSLGFAEDARNGYRAIGHGGDTWAFHSRLYLVPELGLGLFFSQNSTGRGGGGNLREIVWRSFLDRYFPRPTPVDPAVMDPASDTRALAGFYKGTRRWDHSVLKFMSLMWQVKVSVNADGTITSDLVGGKPLREVGLLRYCDAKGEDCIAFRRDAAGGLEMVGAFPHVVFQRVPWYETRPLNLIVIVGSAGVFGLTLALWPIAALTRRHFGRRLNLTRAERRRRLLVRLVCAIDLACILAGRTLFRKLYDLDIDFDPWIHLLQALGFAGAIGTLVALYDGVRCWADRDCWWLSKVNSVAVALACLGFVWFALVWHLFDFSTQY
jgi:CubicO group peptidase (beta-lactamase class C family)